MMGQVIPPVPFQPQHQPDGGYINMGVRHPSSTGYPTGPPQSQHPRQLQQQQQQQTRHLDTDSLPNAIQVMEDNKRTRSGSFVTNLKGKVPPLVTTPYVTEDRGNAGPRFIRSSMYR